MQKKPCKPLVGFFDRETLVKQPFMPPTPFRIACGSWIDAISFNSARKSYFGHKKMQESKQDSQGVSITTENKLIISDWAYIRHK